VRVGPPENYCAVHFKEHEPPGLDLCAPLDLYHVAAAEAGSPQLVGENPDKIGAPQF